MAVASDPTNGPLIAVIDDRGNVWAKEGSLTAPWVEEYSGSGAAAPEAVSVASDPTNGPLIAVSTAGGVVYAKEGSLTAAWVEEFTGAEDEPSPWPWRVTPRMVPSSR